MKPHLQMRESWKKQQNWHTHIHSLTYIRHTQWEDVLCTLYIDAMLLLTWLTLFNRQKVGHKIQIILTIWCWLIFINWTNEFVRVSVCVRLQNKPTDWLTYNKKMFKTILTNQPRECDRARAWWQQQKFIQNTTTKHIESKIL